MEYRLTAPLSEDDVIKLKVGDVVLLSGTIYSARDAAHKRLVQAVKEGKEPPFDIKGSAIYYMGPSPAQPGAAIGAAGPTTSYRMDSFAPFMMEHGMKASIGKGKRNDDVKQAMQKYKAVYFGATGGAGALLSKCIKKAEVIAYDDLGAEAIRKLEIEDMPLLVINDSYGGELYVKPKL